MIVVSGSSATAGFGSLQATVVDDPPLDFLRTDFEILGPPWIARLRCGCGSFAETVTGGGDPDARGSVTELSV